MNDSEHILQRIGLNRAMVLQMTRLNRIPDRLEKVGELGECVARLVYQWDSVPARTLRGLTTATTQGLIAATRKWNEKNPKRAVCMEHLLTENNNNKEYFFCTPAHLEKLTTKNN